MKKHHNRVVKFLSQRAFEMQSALGAAAGVNNRARTQRSARDKARDPRKIRKSRAWMRD